ncbi:MAG: hypothetical protein ACYC90_02375 [Candidatus Nanopelagicales bacterium]
MHYRIEIDTGVFAVDVAVSNGVDATGVAFEAWWFTVIDADRSLPPTPGRGLIVRDPVLGSAQKRDATAVRAAGLCLATDPDAGEALVWFRDDPAGYQGIFTLDHDTAGDRIPMTDADIRGLLHHGAPPTRARLDLTRPARKEATWIRPSSPSSASRTSRLSFE